MTVPQSAPTGHHSYSPSAHPGTRQHPHRALRAKSAVAAAGLICVAVTACTTAPPQSPASASKDPRSGASAGGSSDPEPLRHTAGLPAVLANDGTTIVVGERDAPHAVRISVDPQCGSCTEFEKGGGEAVAKAIRSGRLKAEYTVASFLDRGQVGGSTRA